MYARVVPLLAALALWQPAAAAPAPADASVASSSGSAAASTIASAAASTISAAASTASAAASTASAAASKTSVTASRKSATASRKSATASRTSVTTSRTSVSPSGDPCAAAAASQAASLKGMKLEHPSDILFAQIDAETAWACVQGLPFDKKGGLQLVSIMRQYSQFQTTLAFLNDPPPSYQQPPVDVMGWLNLVEDKINLGEYENEYAFEYDLFQIVGATHEEHFNLQSGIIGTFQWMLNDSMISLSSNGTAIPQVYSYADVMQNSNAYQMSPIMSVNGQSIFKYLQNYAANFTQMGDTEPHADWNVLMSNAAFAWDLANAVDISVWPSYISMTPIYNGPLLNVTFANGSTSSWKYTAGSMSSLLLDKIDSTQAFIDNIVHNPEFRESHTKSGAAASTQAASASGTAAPTAAAASTSTVLSSYTAVPTSLFPGYPQKPDVIQEGFGFGGTVSGYLLRDVSVGVLSLPSFESGDSAPSGASFSAAVTAFIEQAQAAGMRTIVIDISGNGGGTVFQGFDTFAQFFPDLYPNINFRTRAHPAFDTLSRFISGLQDENQTDPNLPKKSEMEFLNNNGFPGFDTSISETPGHEPWPSFSDYLGPLQQYGDNFTNIFQFNLTDPHNMVDTGQYVVGQGNTTAVSGKRWAAEDVIMLSDGQCGSTCSIFSELMKTVAGVRTVVVGGVPEYGPMQSVTGTRGGNVLEWAQISQILSGITGFFTAVGAAKFNKTLADTNLTADALETLPPILDSTVILRLEQGRFNNLDTIRSNTPDVPLQFTYEAADCRLFYTQPMVYDRTVLWKAAGRVALQDLSLCVPGSTNAPGSKPNDTVVSDPGYSYERIWALANTTHVLAPPAAPATPAGKAVAAPAMGAGAFVLLAIVLGAL